MSRAPTGRVRRTSRGADLVIERTFRGTIDDVWESVTRSESTARWIGPWEGEAGPGKTVRLVSAFEEGAPPSKVLIEVCEPPSRLAVSMKDDYGDWKLELSLRSDGETTVLTFVQHLVDPKLAGDTGPGWEYYLDRLVAARAGEVMPKFDEYYPSQRPYYLEAAEREG
ncbi:MAG: SRPBCC family protein [Labilithrix sp.]|nr:SRPBCC family protein [Labilithrix sp.]MBX3218647.1 SRPBCC family protein [Labilithrix sp.]